MQIITPDIEHKIQSGLVEKLHQQDYQDASAMMSEILDTLYANIPANKRISYGVVHTIKVFAQALFLHLRTENFIIPDIASQIMHRSDDWRCQGVALGLLTNYGLTDFPTVLPSFKSAAASADWEFRELSQMFFRRLIKKHPVAAQDFLLKLVSASDPNLRRFVAETLRPVQENRWFYKYPEYPLTVLRNMFHESAPYPRTALGNNLSDLARRLPDLVYEIVAELIATGEKNARWIATRACRNLVKKEPLKVMNLLQTDEYKYKTSYYQRSDYEGQNHENNV